MNERPAWYVLLLMILSVFVGLFIGSAFGLLVGSWVYHGNGNIMNFSDPTPEMSLALMLMQGITSVMSFFLVPYLTWRYVCQAPVASLTVSPFRWTYIPFIIAITLSFIVVDSIVIDWNQGLQLPGTFQALEDWARQYEDQLEKVTKLLTNFQTFGDFALGFVVIAVLAGITEEFFFRGVIQFEITRAVKNQHLAIWITAIFFSAIHIQFFGFFPRMLLGALFGYLYAWSGNIYVPMIAHVVNNGLSVTAIYLSHLGVVDEKAAEEAAPWPAVVVFAVIGGVLLYSFRKMIFQKRKLAADGRPEIQ